MPFLVALALSLLAGAVLAAALVFIGIAVSNGYVDIATVIQERRAGARRSDHLSTVTWGIILFIAAAALAAIVLICTFFIMWIWTEGL